MNSLDFETWDRFTRRAHTHTHTHTLIVISYIISSAVGIQLKTESIFNKKERRKTLRTVR